jgi:hypothetical protein
VRVNDRFELSEWSKLLAIWHGLFAAYQLITHLMFLLGIGAFVKRPGRGRA